MPCINEDEAQSFRQAASWFRQYFLSEFYRVLDANLPSGVTRVGHLATLYESVDQIVEQCTFKERRIEDVKRTLELADDLIPCLKRILIARRRHEAEGAEIQAIKTHNQLVIDNIEKGLRELDDLLQLPWLKTVMPLRMPQVFEFLSTESIQKGPPMRQLAAREFDEKFHILQAPDLMLKDLSYYREICESRGVPVVVAYLDIDDFKRFNERYGETNVDRWLLPSFMRTLEAEVFEHGFAYREGGDEYMMVLPNFSRGLATYFLQRLSAVISAMKFPHIEDSLTVSIGFCYVNPDCPLTNREIRTMANTAKTFAKAAGKNGIATYLNDNFEDDALRVIELIAPELSDAFRLVRTHRSVKAE